MKGFFVELIAQEMGRKHEILKHNAYEKFVLITILGIPEALHDCTYIYSFLNDTKNV